MPDALPPHTPPAEAAPLSGQVGHYENFPVASWLCPPALRPAVAAIYHFARTADDIADEGPASAEERLADLAEYRACLTATLSPSTNGAPPRWRTVFEPLALAVRTHDLPTELLRDLISAFEQDVRFTASAQGYAHLDELLAYCKLSANPVGRLMLHLYGVNDSVSLTQSDRICSALQLINFWQDLSEDLPRGRHYLPADLLDRHGLQRQDFLPGAVVEPAVDVRRQKLVARLCDDARARMSEGAPLALRLPGRAGWELRLVVQGGLRILDKVSRQRHRSWEKRVKVGKLDVPILLWRSLWMG
ncbi:squalene synthase HpnC [Hydrogenophaga sp. PAMC20947]|uniref:squalene synthase HpnC n=1 Tax=Hydrogenophaga sp. PAMC20947 TaxID=2565558 RepID=UPI00109DAB7B|nr:squalene synthase HpnC [Hydrogenophaga sp. PAMC20947]QCB45082.1 squalene synthase HpnC [Hydrogenophaga sp. PAMC20947]